MPELPELASNTLLAIFTLAFITGVLHGATGMAGGIVMTAFLAHFIGIKMAVPVMSCALIFSHASRILMHWQHTDRKIAGQVLLFGTPTIVLGAYIFTFLDAAIVALLFAAMLLLSFPVKRWARRNDINTGPRLLAFASSVWGLLAGNVTGPGFFLAPFLLGTGMGRLTFVGTLASITLMMNITKLAVFGAAAYITAEWLLLGVLIGLVKIPGNWVGKILLQRMNDRDHSVLVDVMTVMMIVYFIYLGVFQY